MQSSAESNLQAVRQALRSDEAITELARKNSIPDEFRETYGIAWRKHPGSEVDTRSKKTPVFQSHNTLNSLEAAERGKRIAAAQHQAEEAARRGARHNLNDPDHNIATTWRKDIRTPMWKERHASEAHHHHVPSVFRGSANEADISSKLQGLWKTNQADAMSTTMLPRTQSDPASFPLSPSKAELEHQRQACFSTQRLPWLGRKKPPKEAGVDLLVKALVMAMQEAGKIPGGPPLHDFRMAYNPHRDGHNHSEIVKSSRPVEGDAVKLRRQVLKGLERYPLCDIRELLACDPDTWLHLSRCLGGLAHGQAVRCAMSLLASADVRPVDRALYHAAVSQRQRSVDRGRQVFV